MSNASYTRELKPAGVTLEFTGTNQTQQFKLATAMFLATTRRCNGFLGINQNWQPNTHCVVASLCDLIISRNGAKAQRFWEGDPEMATKHIFFFVSLRAYTFSHYGKH